VNVEPRLFLYLILSLLPAATCLLHTSVQHNHGFFSTSIISPGLILGRQPASDTLWVQKSDGLHFFIDQVMIPLGKEGLNTAESSLDLSYGFEGIRKSAIWGTVLLSEKVMQPWQLWSACSTNTNVRIGENSEIGTEGYWQIFSEYMQTLLRTCLQYPGGSLIRVNENECGWNISMKFCSYAGRG
jgi:hypothetical protein